MSELRLSGTENFIPSAEITQRTSELAKFYDELYGDNEVVVMTVLKGASRFATNLTGAMINPNIIEDDVRVSSREGIASGDVVVTKEPDTHIKGMDVLVVEDIDDTRKTLDFLLPRLRDQAPRRLDVVSLLNKPTVPKVAEELDADTVRYGFDIVDQFVVGHGLDWKKEGSDVQRWRSLAHISLAHDISLEGEEEFWAPIVPIEPLLTPVVVRQRATTVSDYMVVGLQ